MTYSLKDAIMLLDNSGSEFLGSELGKSLKSLAEQLSTALAENTDLQRERDELRSKLASLREHVEEAAESAHCFSVRCHELRRKLEILGDRHAMLRKALTSVLDYIDACTITESPDWPAIVDAREALAVTEPKL